MGQLEEMGIRDLAISRDALEATAQLNSIDPELPRSRSVKSRKEGCRFCRCAGVIDDAGIAGYADESGFRDRGGRPPSAAESCKPVSSM